ncbi:hypothetical protein MUN78_04580 [Leucobacter allii]|uniref:Uncharacterized protein n=1 Tax=Leucobacter allii TaxID=2932247 RepID=A0ABY4FPB6_9MICO|nr:hypothetical protein [Leucobacter allii]UOQ58128.1 hypothetical protein MUN78_04580 [Leucobacter allii]
MDWTRIVWRLLCLLTAMSALLAMTGPFWVLPPLLQGVLLLMGLLAGACLCIAGWADWSQRSDRR